ncbi:nucleotidyltransferase family protein [Yoonia sp. BS5-3]|uniref:Nucleotidyltransferase family protein n=1 Tax=Yoonia phaeophyticola TaxID=3137369 RepID=A0ABZ2V595_9RHOB
MNAPILFFAAGLGTRMGVLVKDKPKPLVKVAGRALIDHALDLAEIPQVERRVVNIHYRANMITEHLRNRAVVFSDETTQLLETGGGLKKAIPALKGNPVLTMNTDAVWKGPNPIKFLLESWKDHMEALLVLVPKDRAVGHSGRGDFNILDNGQLERAPGPVYTGLQMIRTDCFANIEETAFSMNVVWDQIAARGGLFGCLYDGGWCDVGQPDSIPLAEAMLDV